MVLLILQKNIKNMKKSGDGTNFSIDVGNSAMSNELQKIEKETRWIIKP